MNHHALRLDRTDFPMLWVPEIGLYVHGLPVTKVQFEDFLSDATDGHFDSRWYEEVRSLNPRVSARRIERSNYWNAFLSGILPAEVERFAAWCGPGYRLLSTSEWQRLYRTLEKQNATSLEETGLLAGLALRHRELITRVECAVEDACAQSGAPCHLPERTLMRLGLIEWTAIEEPDQNLWAGLGEPHPSFCGNLFAPAKGDFIQPADAETRRLASFGFRLAFDPNLAPEDC